MLPEKPESILLLRPREDRATLIIGKGFLESVCLLCTERFQGARLISKFVVVVIPQLICADRQVV
jgi:hypothetical protein